MAFRDGRRLNETMRSVSASLTDEEIEALAAYFATLGARSTEQDGG